MFNVNVKTTKNSKTVNKSSPKIQKAVTNKKFKIDFLIDFDALNQNTPSEKILRVYSQKHQFYDQKSKQFRYVF